MRRTFSSSAAQAYMQEQRELMHKISVEWKHKISVELIHKISVELIHKISVEAKGVSAHMCGGRSHAMQRKSKP